MKFLFAVLVSFSILASAARAAADAPIPNCWKESGQDIEDGQFLVGLNVSTVSGRGLADALRLFQSQYTVSPNFPWIFGDSVIVLMKAVDYGVGDHQLTRDELKKQVDAQLEKILSTHIVDYVECNGHSHPASML